MIEVRCFFQIFLKISDQGDPVTYLMDPVNNKLVREEERGKGLENGASAAVEAHANIFVAKVPIFLSCDIWNICVHESESLCWICCSLEQVNSNT